MRAHDTIYVVGAGFSSGLGYPLTKNLLIDVWSRLRTTPETQLREIIAFHHPLFTNERKTSFPDIEQLLTEIAVNLDLFDASRAAEGGFKKDHLENAREGLLSEIARWFHELYKPANQISWLHDFVRVLRKENAAIISFNWDLVLDQELFEEGINSENYGLAKNLPAGPILLKPHGSLNWYEAKQIKNVASEKRIVIFPHRSAGEQIEAFLRPREIKSKTDKRYTPLIVPPTYLKDFKRPIFRKLWQRCTHLLSTTKRIIFLGYSLPSADLHAQFIFRCGFHNQIEGILRQDGTRQSATGAAKVVIVNPDQEAALRIEAVAGPQIICEWVPKRIQEWCNALKD